MKFALILAIFKERTISLTLRSACKCIETIEFVYLGNVAPDDNW